MASLTKRMLRRNRRRRCWARCCLLSWSVASPMQLTRCVGSVRSSSSAQHACAHHGARSLPTGAWALHEAAPPALQVGRSAYASPRSRIAPRTPRDALGHRRPRAQLPPDALRVRRNRRGRARGGASNGHALVGRNGRHRRVPACDGRRTSRGRPPLIDPSTLAWHRATYPRR